MKNYRNTILSMAFCILLSSLSIAHGQIYKWTDEHGNIGLTDDLSTIPEKYRESATQIGPTEEPKEDSRTPSTHPELPRRQRSQTSSDLMEEMVRKFQGMSYQWTQDMSLWIKVPAMMASNKEDFSEMAAKIANHYHRQKGHLICVRFYYGSGRVIAYECR